MEGGLVWFRGGFTMGTLFWTGGLVYDSIPVRRSSHWGESPQNRLGDEWTCEMTLASAYVLRHLSATWSQLQMKGEKSEWM